MSMSELPKHLVVDGKRRALPKLAPCKRCGRAPHVSTGYLSSDGTPLIPGGHGPFMLKCDHGLPYNDERPEFYLVRSWDYDRAIAMWQRGNGGKVRRRDMKRRRRRQRRQRNARVRARGWA